MDILSEGLFVGFLTFPFLRQENNIIFKNIGENKWRVCGNDNLQITGNRFLYNFAQIRDIQSLPFRMVIQISLIYKQNGGIIFNDDLKELVELKEMYPETQISEICDLINGERRLVGKANLTSTDIRDMVFGKQVPYEEYGKKPLAKFRHDILKDLGVYTR